MTTSMMVAAPETFARWSTRVNGDSAAESAPAIWSYGSSRTISSTEPM